MLENFSSSHTLLDFRGRSQIDRARNTSVVFARDDGQKGQKERCKAPGALGTLHDGS